MYNKIETINYVVNKKLNFFQPIPILPDYYIHNVQGLISECLDYISSDIFFINPFPCIFLSFRKTYGIWNLFCEPSFEKLDLCQSNPYKNIILEINIIKQLLITKNIKTFPIHLSLTIYENSNQLVHANTLIISDNKLYLFEPKGSITRIVSDIKSSLFKSLQIIARKCNLKFIGYLSENLNFQGNNNTICYLWTSWFEILIMLNSKKKPEQIKNYMRKIYLSIEKVNIPSNISGYLMELANDKL